MRLSEPRLDDVANGPVCEMQRYECAELVRGYRRAAALEDMLREWVDSRDVSYSDIPLLQRTEALLEEGDE